MSIKTLKKDTKKAEKVNHKKSPVVDVTRKIDPKTQLLLYVLSGGRCEFDGCNKNLIEHHLTHKRLNLGQQAHIVAFSENGPRGDVAGRPADINNFDNLMLLCHACHKQIDDFPEEFSRETLENYKKAHEERIALLTSSSPDRKTSSIVIKSKVGGQTVRISPADVIEAVSPRYPASRNPVEIDLTGIPDEGSEFYTLALRKVERGLENFLDSVMEEENTSHISVFGLAPIPILIFAGNFISNKVPCSLYQKHRDSQNWKWKQDGKSAQYNFHKLKTGANNKKVALILSLSGSIHLDTLPSNITDDATIYEIILDGTTPHTGFLRQEQDLTNFENTYLLALREINANHGRLEKIHLFPAVPAPVAISCGRQLLPKADPILVVYDDDKRTGGFTEILEVNA